MPEFNCNLVPEYASRGLHEMLPHVTTFPGLHVTFLPKKKSQFFKGLNNKWDPPHKARCCITKHPTLHNFEGAIELTKNTLKQSVILFKKKKYI